MGWMVRGWHPHCAAPCAGESGGLVGEEEGFEATAWRPLHPMVCWPHKCRMSRTDRGSCWCTHQPAEGGVGWLMGVAEAGAP